MRISTLIDTLDHKHVHPLKLALFGCMHGCKANAHVHREIVCRSSLQ